MSISTLAVALRAFLGPPDELLSSRLKGRARQSRFKLLYKRPSVYGSTITEKKGLRVKEM